MANDVTLSISLRFMQVQQSLQIPDIKFILIFIKQTAMRAVF